MVLKGISKKKRNIYSRKWKFGKKCESLWYLNQDHSFSPSSQLNEAEIYWTSDGWSQGHRARSLLAGELTSLKKQCFSSCPPLPVAEAKSWVRVVKSGGLHSQNAENIGAPIVLTPACKAVILSQKRQAEGFVGYCALLHRRSLREALLKSLPQLQSPSSKILPGGRILTVGRLEKR